MDDIRAHFFAVLIGILHIELLGEELIDLNRDDGVLLAKDVFVLDIELGAVEGGLVDADGILDAEIVEDFAHDALRLFPLFRRADVFFRVVGVPLGETEGAVVEHAHGAEAEFRQLQAAAEFLFKLIGAENQVPLRNRELTDADQSVHLAGILVSEQRRGLSEAHRQIAVGAGAVQKYLVLERTGHRTQREAFLGFVVGISEHKHAVEVVIPVAGDLVQLALGHKRGLGEQIAAPLFLVLHPALQGLDHARALRQQDGQPLPDHVHGREIFQLPAELVVVALFGLLHRFEIGVQLVLGGECRAVNALEHFILLAAAPVGAGDAQQLIRLDAARIREVRAGAEVDKFALLIKADRLALGDVGDQFELIRLAALFHQRGGLVARQLEAADFQIFLNDFFHLGLDFFEILAAERRRRVEIVVKAVVDGRADGELTVGVQAFDRLRHHMRGAVPQRLQIFFFHFSYLLSVIYILIVDSLFIV